jgi:hypothetical protein
MLSVPVALRKGWLMGRHLVGLGIGIAAGVADCLVYYLSGMSIGIATAVSGVAFWATVGWAIHATHGSAPGYLRGILISLFFNIPWLIEFAWNQGATDLLVPVLIVGTVLGAAMGAVSQRLRRSARHDGRAIEA